jgi:hypothetical protein
MISFFQDKIHSMEEQVRQEILEAKAQLEVRNDL